VSATAERDGGAPAESKGTSFHIDEFDFPFDAQWTIIANSNFSGRHSGSLFAGAYFTQIALRGAASW